MEGEETGKLFSPFLHLKYECKRDTKRNSRYKNEGNGARGGERRLFHEYLGGWRGIAHGIHPKKEKKVKKRVEGISVAH